MARDDSAILISSARAVLAAERVPETRWHGILASLKRHNIMGAERVVLSDLGRAIRANR